MDSELEQASPNLPESPSKPKRNYPKSRKSPSQAAPILPNPAIAQMESALVPLMDQRMAASQRVRAIQARANQVNNDLEMARGELAAIEGEVNFRLMTIAQMKGIPFTPSAQSIQNGVQFPIQTPRQFADYPQQPPSPLYQPVSPYPTMPPPMPGVGSYPAPNQGLHPDASPRGYVVDPEQLVNNDSEYQFPPDVIAKINEGRR